MANFVFVVIFILLLKTPKALSEEYDVTVVTDPPCGPFLVGNEIEFSCHVDPAPPEPVTYGWHAVKDTDGPTTFQSGHNHTARYTPNYRDLHFSWFFCKVFSANGTLIDVGKRRVEIHGFIFSEESLVRSFTSGDTIELQVNITDDSLASHIRTLAWYHNGTEISTSGRITVQNDDAGTYQVEVASLDFSYECPDATWLYFLRNHAAHAPVTFTVWELRQPTGCDHKALEKPLLQYYPLVTGDTSTLLSIQESETLTDYDSYYVIASILSYSYATLSVNGTTVSDDGSGRKFNVSQTIIGSSTLLNEINFQYNASDEGFYILLPYIAYYYIEQQLLCYPYCGYSSCYDYSSYTTGFLNLYHLSFTTLPFVLTTYKAPSVSISSSYDKETDREQINCTAYGGVPDSYNITLKQQEVSATARNTLQIYPSRFGEYICTVESLYNTTEVALLLQEKALFQLLLVPETNRHDQIQCATEWKKRENIHEEITKLFQSFCGCAVDLHSISTNCSTPGPGNSLVKGAVSYSNSEGNITARTLVDMLQVWLLTSTDPILTLGGQSFKLNTQCPPRVNLVSPNICINLATLSAMEDKGPAINGVIGGSFVGGMVVGFLTCVTVLCIGLCVVKLKEDMKMKQAGSKRVTYSTAIKPGEEVEMGTNQAYEQMEIHRQSVSTRKTFEGSTMEEPIYESAT